MLHCLDVLWVNGFILYRETSKAHPYVTNNKTILDQKRFLKLLIHSLLERANVQKETEKAAVALASVKVPARHMNHDDVFGAAEQPPAPALKAPKFENRSQNRSVRMTVDNHDLDKLYPKRLGCTTALEKTSGNECKYCKMLQLKFCKAHPRETRTNKWPHVAKSSFWCPACCVNLCKEGDCYDKWHGRG